MAQAKKTAGKKAPAKKRSQPQARFIRNLRNVHVSLRAQERRIELAPRGQRNDKAPLQKGDQADETFMGDKGVLFEVISKAEADKITENQAVNQQQQRHPALAQIRTAEGDPYPDDAVRVEQQHDQQGKVVAHVDESEEAKRGKHFEWGVGIRRAELPGTTDRPLPDIPDSIAPEEAGQFRLERASEQEAAEEADAVARSNRVQGPQAGLGNISQVSKNPVQRT